MSSPQQQLENLKERHQQAQMLQNDGKPEAALEVYRAILETDDRYLPALHQVAKICESRGEFDEAIAAYRKAIEVDDESPFWVYRHLGFALSQKEDLDGAIEAYEQAVALQPEGITYALIGQVKGKNRDLDGEIVSYKKAIELSSELPIWVYLNLGAILSEKGQVVEAISAYEKALELEPENAGIQRLLEVARVRKVDSKIVFSEPIHREVPLNNGSSNGSYSTSQPTIAIEKDLPTPDMAVEIGKLLFEDEFYRQQYALEENIQLLTRQEAFRHFLEQIPNLERPLPAPTAWFFPDIYRDIHGDKITRPGNPFLHYLVNGYIQGLSPLSGIEDVPLKVIQERIAPLFDAEFYLSNSPDLDPEQVDPLEHFLIYGWREGRNPAPWFDLSAYQKEFPLVRDLKINPLYFYACLHFGDPRRRAYSVGQPRSRFKKAIELSPQRKTRRTPRTAVEFQSLLKQTKYLQPNKHARPLTKAKAKQLRIHIVIPEFSKGGGGHMTIFRIVRWLEFFGHECTVWVKDPDIARHPTGWRDDVYRDYQQVKASFLPLSVHFWYVTGDVLVATSWDTVETVMAHDNFNDRFYLIQDYEPYFFARGSAALRAEDTYRQDIACICASTWLKKLMTEKFGRWARHFDLAYESDVYKVREDKDSSLQADEEQVSHLIVYSRKHTARRAVELCLEALDELAHRRDDFVVHFFGDNEAIADISYRGFHHGILDKQELAELYNAGTMGITFSATNYSLVPQEMMACGLPIVEVENESTVSIFPADVATMARPNPGAIADAIEALMDDPLRRDRQQEAALNWISELSWETSARAVERAFLDHLREIDRLEEPVTTSSLQVNEKPKYRASVVIPTFNGGQLFTEVLDRVRQQHTPWPFQITIVDSSSTDGTHEYLSQQEGILFHAIPQSEFQHGATRNLGAKLSDAEYIAFLTQDALPAGNYWLYDLVSCLEAHPSAAGAFGRHIAYEDASEFTKRDLLGHFEGFDRFPVELSLQTDFEKLKQGDRGWQQVLHFYSDNNSCLRKSVWERYPYPEVAYGEDQLWADTIIKAGYSKVYSKAALVYHSHDYDYQETFKRAKTEAEFFWACFGYKLVENRMQLESDLETINKRDIKHGNEKGLTVGDIAHQLNLNRAKFEGWFSFK